MNPDQKIKDIRREKSKLRQVLTILNQHNLHPVNIQPAVEKLNNQLDAVIDEYNAGQMKIYDRGSISLRELVGRLKQYR